MSNETIYLPNYTVGQDAYSKIGYITAPYGNKAVVIGGETAIEKAKPALLNGIEGSHTVLLDFLWYGGAATMDNVHQLAGHPHVKDADMLFGVGGGRACDTVKVLGAITGKPVFTFPTLASNCAACTSLSVMYHNDGSFAEYFYQSHPPLHTFINTQIIAESPAEMFWAGIGDALSKEYEVEYCCRDKKLTHLPQLGLGIAKTCTAPLLDNGKKALEDCRNNQVSAELEEVVLAIVMLTGIVSNCAVHISDQIAPEDQYYYNSSLAHCVYYGSSLIPASESQHLHGEIVAFGVLCLLKYDNNEQEFNRILEFNKSLGLPVTIAEIGLTEADLPIVAEKAASVIEWEVAPGTPTQEKFIAAILAADAIGRQAA
ncbi:iron-containing alcohol dehydrogenase family protein [Vibrio nitrifigilis]|uniref:Glycerol dehydrogenase n=1 Tax=Vibrio nitrifigilis TaxID=2789781 RepID=A0ABS0GKE1_9VIBR|nr:iron-containing alcohol dehydrogenase family protein [Vibrio nitrifigilis]MBF9002934.1 iron-containing alcohol dehydrogenase family protein [Vibrio nitrifigilis]